MEEDKFICVRGMQLLLSIFGHDLSFSCRNVFIKLIIFIIKLIWFGMMIANLIYGLYMEDIRPTITFAILFQPNIYNILFFTILSIKMRRISNFIRHISTYLHYSDVSHFNRRSYMTLLMLLNPVIILVSIACYSDQVMSTYSIFWNWNMNEWFMLMTAILHQIFMRTSQSFPSICTAIYIFIYHLHIKVHMNLLIGMKTNLNGKKCVHKNVEFMKNFDEIFLIHSNFENIFSFFPFIQLSDLFISCTRAIILSKILSLWILYLNLIMDIINALILIFTINHMKDNFNDFIDNIRHEINCKRYPNLSVSSRMLINANLDKMRNIQYTASAMFTLQPSLLLTFSNALVSFTVLLVSMT